MRNRSDFFYLVDNPSSTNCDMMVVVMNMNIKEELSKTFAGLCDGMMGIEFDPNLIQTVFVNETVPGEANEDFYGDQEGSYALSIRRLFEGTPNAAFTPTQLLNQGIYFTNVMKNVKLQSIVNREDLLPYVEVLKEELSYFPSCARLFLMGDVAIQAYTMLNRMEGKKRVIPAGSTYKLRKQTYFDGYLQVIPSYIMTGKNLSIEKSKLGMIQEDVERILFSTSKREEA